MPIVAGRMPVTLVRYRAPPNPTTSAAAVCATSNGTTLRPANQRADRDAPDVGAEQRHLHEHGDLRRVWLRGCQRPQRDADDGEVGRERGRPSQAPPVQCIAEPQRDDAKHDQQQRKRHRGAGLRQQDCTGRRGPDDGNPRDHPQPLVPRDEQHGGGQHGDRYGTGRSAKHLEFRRRFHEQRERDHRGCEPVERRACGLLASAGAVGDDQPQHCVQETHGQPERGRHDARVRHGTQEKAAGQHEEQPADE